MSDTPIWEQTVTELDIDPDYSLDMYRAYSELKFMKIDIGNSLDDYEVLGALVRQIVDTVIESFSWITGVGDSEMQDKADRYRER